jgi:hypothetical protein
MTLNPLKIGLTTPEFTAYIDKIHPTKFTNNGHAIVGAVLHNTAMPTLKMVNGYLDSKRWTPEQLVDNWWVSYRKQGWSAGPHMFILPHKIYIATPLDHNGTHSPAYNAGYWGMEMVGDYSFETLPDEMRAMAVHAFADMYRTLGKKADASNFHFHGEDTSSSHRHCPGVNVGPKDRWLHDINAVYHK